jgi:two-component system, cell cycle sensor histidine kinase PleC
MGKTGAWGATGGRFFAGGRGGEGTKIGNGAGIVAAPAYKRLLAAEPYLRRSIPALIVIFLIVVAATRALSLLALRDDI